MKKVIIHNYQAGIRDEGGKVSYHDFPIQYDEPSNKFEECLFSVIGFIIQPSIFVLIVSLIMLMLICLPVQAEQFKQFGNEIINKQAVTHVVLMKNSINIYYCAGSDGNYPTYLTLIKASNYDDKMKKFNEINPKKIFLKNKRVFNDQQVCVPFIVNDAKFGFISNAKTHYLQRDDSEFFSNMNEEFGETELLEKLELDFKNLYQLKKEYTEKINEPFKLFLDSGLYEKCLSVLKLKKEFAKKFNLKNKQLLVCSRTANFWKHYLFKQLLFRK